MTIKEISEKLNIPFKGDGSYQIHFLKDIERLEESSPKENCLYFLESQKMLNNHPSIINCDAVLTVKKFSDKFANALIVESFDFRLKLIETLKLFEQNLYREKSFPRSTSYIAETAQIAEDATIMPGAVIMENAIIKSKALIYPNVVVEAFTEIGENTTLHPNVVISDHCIIGSNCRVFSSTVIGADGFGFYDHGKENRHKIPQIGNVIIQDHVEIGAGCTIDRATIESTVIGEHTKLDDQVHVGHNCRVGRYVYMAGGVVLAGSVVIEDYAMIAGQTAIAPGVRVHSGAVLMGMSATNKDLEANKIYLGAVQAMPAKKMHRATLLLMQLPEIINRLNELEEKLKDRS